MEPPAAAPEPMPPIDPATDPAGDAAPARRPRIWWRVAVPIVAGLAVAAGALLLGGQYADARLERSTVDARSAQAAVESAHDEFAASAQTARVMELQAIGLADAIDPAYGATPDEVRAAVDAVHAAIADPAAEPGEPLPAPRPVPVFPPFWNEIVAVAHLDTAAAAQRADVARIDETRAALNRSDDELRTAVLDVFDELDAFATAELEAATVATNRSRAVLQHVVDRNSPEWLRQPASDDAYRAYERAIEAVRASQTAEAARRAEPEYATRGPIEDFARSIARGVPLDFAWAYEVNGLASDEWYAGTAEWEGEDWVLITLSHSIDEQWSVDPDAEAVVVHEVGHAQVLRPECATLFASAEIGEQHEVWATAWAIAQGYDRAGAGISAYGRPSDAQIAVAARCG